MDVSDFVSILTGLLFGFALVVTIDKVKKEGIFDSIGYIVMSCCFGILWIAVIVYGMEGLIG